MDSGTVDSHSELILVLIAGLAVFIAQRALMDAVIARRVPAAGWLAVVYCLPTAVMSVLATSTGRTAIAIELVFASSIACLAMGCGAVAVLRPVAAAPPARRVWLMLAPVTLLLFLCGFSAQFSLTSVLILLVQGLCVALLWSDKTADSRSTAVKISAQEVSNSTGFGPVQVIQLVLALALAGVGAWLALRAMDRLAMRSSLVSNGLLCATLLAPMLALPIIILSSAQAEQGNGAVAVTGIIGAVFLNLLLTLPTVVLISRGHDLITLLNQNRSNLASTHPAAVAERPLTVISYPVSLWRVDSVVLMLLAFTLLPVAVGRWPLARRTGIALLLGYFAYLVLETIATVHQL